MISHVIFDLGNVLIGYDYMTYLAQVAGDRAEEVADAVFRHELWHEFDRGALTQAQLCAELSRQAPHLSALIGEVLEHWESMLQPLPDSLVLLDDVLAAGYDAYVLSNYPRESFERTLRRVDFFPKFAGGVVSYAEGVVKPEPAIYERLLDRYGLQAAECVFLDDAAVNIVGARAAGLQAIQFQNAAQARRELRQLGVRV